MAVVFSIQHTFHKFKRIKRAFLCGETGGAYNGTVARFMPRITLPRSDIQIHRYNANGIEV
jgi:hypothetical protein